MPQELLIAVVSVIVAAAACVATWVNVARARQNDTERTAANHAEVMTKLGFLQNDLKDVKSDMRNMRAEMNEIRSVAEQAASLARDAHNRLDRAGIDRRDT